MNTHSPLLPMLLVGLTSGLTGAPQQELQGAGQVAVHSATTAHTTLGSAWQAVPGLRGAVTLPRGGDLAVTVSIAGRLNSSNARLLARVKVGSRTAFPWSMPFLQIDPSTRNTVCTFFVTGLPAGTHLVSTEVQPFFGSATLIWRSMILRFADANSKGIRMAMAQRGSLTRSGAFGYADVPDVATTVVVPWPAKLMILASGDFGGTTPGKDLYVRAVVDGKATEDRLVEEGGASIGCRATTLTTARLGAGSHSVKLQWSSESSASLSACSMVVVAIQDQINYTSGFFFQGGQFANTTTTATAFAPIPSANGGSIWVPSRCDVAIRFGGEVNVTNSGRCRLRCTFDNQVVPHGLAELGTFQGLWRSSEVLYVVRNVDRGWHRVSMEWAATAGSKLYLGDRKLAVTAVTGQRPLLVTSTESNRPANYQYGGLFANSVVDIVGSKRTFKAYVRSNFFGKTFPGVADWFAENARGNMHVVEAAVIGPNLKIFDEKTYRSLPNAFTAMKLEALTYADLEFDYSYYDRDGDGQVKPDELYALCVFYQDTTFGEVRPLPPYTSRDGVTVDYAGGIATAYTPDFKAVGQLGVICHELSHLLLGAGDMYETSHDPTAPGPYSIMDQHHLMGHLDPLHKLKQGRWYEAYDQGVDRWLVLTPVSSGGSLVKLFDPSSHSGEYFLVENRYQSYNAWLPSKGLAVWHCDESRLPNWRTAVELEPAGGITNPNRYQNYLFKGTESGFDQARDVWNYSTNTNLRWRDNTASNLGLWAIERQADGSMRVFIDTTAPGVLVQFEKRRLYLDGTGNAKARVRVVNTSTFKDTFQIDVSILGYASWRRQIVTLQPYEVRYFDVLLRPSDPNKPDVSITASGTSVTTTDQAKVYYTLLASGTGAIGTQVTLHLVNGEQKGASYLMGVSGGNLPGFNLPGGLHVPLNVDPLLNTFHTAPSIFSNFFGSLSLNTGTAQAYLNIPNIAGLRGIKLYFAYVTADTSQTFTSVSNGASVTTN